MNPPGLSYLLPQTELSDVETIQKEQSETHGTVITINTMEVNQKGLIEMSSHISVMRPNHQV